MKTYWYRSSRGFANEYAIGIATSKNHTAAYDGSGWERISRDRAIRELANKGDAATDIYASVQINGVRNSYEHGEFFGRFEIARALRAGVPVERWGW